ncbi:hypothetical protein MD484_g5587, partial [Candolleomyces efflorescens]
MTSVEFFPNNAGPWQAEHVEFNAHISSAAGPEPLERLKAKIAPGAIHDSIERSDSPKCAPETRVAAQNNLYGWIIDGDGSHEQPKNIKWVTGPAGSGKTAVMGSLSKRCKEGGVLGATFFFSSWSGSVGRRRKTPFVATIAHQLAQYHPDLRENIATAVNENPDVFEKTLETQMEVLVLLPLQRIPRPVNEPGLRGAIIIDGVDECEAEQYHEAAALGSKSTSPPLRTKEQDQLEILQALQFASADPSFPFRILIASRPERVFREFFNPKLESFPFARKVDLHEDYNADVDIAVFLTAELSRIRDRYNLPESWASPDIVRALVEKASGQFIYAATVVRALEMGSQGRPEASLKAILSGKSNQKATSNPLEQLDVLYSHIFESSPDALLSVRWIRGIHTINQSVLPNEHYPRPVSVVNMLFQTDPESSEAEYLLGPLRSLIRIPPPSDQRTTGYDFYHKSLLDFLEDPDRCGRLYIEEEERNSFIWGQFNLACIKF